MPPEITALLAPDEKLIWSGRPRPSVFVMRGLPNLGYGIAWGVLGAVWYHGARMAPFVYSGWWRIVPFLSFPFILAGFSFFFYPIRLGAQARRTWYVVTDRRIFIMETPPSSRPNDPPKLRLFTVEEMCAPVVQKRFDSFDDVILTTRALVNPHLLPRLDAGFLGIEDGEAAANAVSSVVKLPAYSAPK